MNPLVSVIVPAYNCGQFIPQMVYSFQNQTYPNWEMVIVDDQSQDNTLEVAINESRKDRRLHVTSAPHGGHAAAFSHALYLAQGDILLRQDADDWSAPDRLEREMSLFVDKAVDVVSCYMTRVYSNGKQSPVKEGPLNVADYLAGRPSGPICASIIARRWVYDAVGGFTPGHMSGDSDWNLRVMAYRPRIQWAFLPEYLYFYRDHPLQVTKAYRQAMLADHRANCSKYRNAILRGV